MSDRIFFSGLNGLRALAALGVVLAHTTQGLSAFGLDSFVFGKNADGSPRSTLLVGYAVTIFFVLSGFLITYLLLEEKKAGTLNIRNFYMRRALRILPLYYLYLLVALLTVMVFDLPFEPSSVAYYLLPAANIPLLLGTTIPLLTHYWSLGVEEQFYAWWPWIVAQSTALLKVTVWLCAGLIALKFTLRLIDMDTLDGDTGMVYRALHISRFHCMLIGAIGAILYQQRHGLIMKVAHSFIMQLMAWSILVLVIINRFHLASVLNQEVVAVATLVIIMGQIEKRTRIINLQVVVADFIGKISYGIYVWHPLVIFYLSRRMAFSDPGNIRNYVLVYGAVLVSTLCVASLSFFFYEKLFLNMKQRYASVSAPSIS